MAKKSLRTPWTEDAAKLAWIRTLQRVKASEIVKELASPENVIGVAFPGKTNSSIHTLTSSIRKGKHDRFSHLSVEIPDMESIPEQFTSVPKQARQRGRKSGYDDGRNEFLWRARNQLNLSWNDTAERYNAVFGEEKTNKGLMTQYHRLNLKGYSPTNPDLDIDDYMASLPDSDVGGVRGKSPRANLAKAGTGSLREKLVQQDKRASEVLVERADFIYSALIDQADRVKNFDLVNTYGGTSLADLMSLGDSERERIVTLLERGSNGEAIKNIELFVMGNVVSGRSGISVVMPTYVDDEKKSASNLRSALNDTAFAVLSQATGLKRANPFRGRFRDLVTYGFNVSGEGPDYSALGDQIASELEDEYEGIGVSFLVDSFPVELYGKLRGK